MRTVVWLGIVTVAAACAGAPGPGAVDELGGLYSGRLLVGSQRFDAEFDLGRLRAGAVRGSFAVQAPLEIEGAVSGVVIGDLLRLTLTYESDGGDDGAACPGRIEGILDVSAEGAAVDGPVTITDCGNSLAGRLSFRR